MRVFVTGASGHIGSAVVPELLSAGHEVIGLARSDSAAEKVAATGADVLRGDLADVEALGAAAAAADAVIHLAFRHDLMQVGDMDGAAAADLGAIKAIAHAIDGTGKPFVGTSGTLLLARINSGEVGTEAHVAEGGYRIDAENLVIGLADRGVRSSVIRLPPTVHSSLDRHGFVPALIGFARDKGYAAYVGDGTSHWSAVHTLDAAQLYRLALENSPAGTRYHGVGDEGVPFKEIAETIGRHLDLPVRSIDPAAAGEYFSYLTEFVQLDGVVSAGRTREMLDWTPNHPGLIDDLSGGHYFRTSN
jgi:nucleoside-diphosphate-sugar epimerase